MSHLTEPGRDLQWDSGGLSPEVMTFQISFDQIEDQDMISAANL